MAVRIQLRRDTAANWASANPTPAAGEACFATDTGVLKIGDGVTAYNSLDEITGSGGGVELTGDQTIAGIKTFTASPLVPGPTTEFQAATRGYVDTTALLDSEVDADLKTLALPANTTISTFAATVLDDADAAAARTTLGVVATADAASAVLLTAAEYAALTPDPDTIYYIVG